MPERNTLLQRAIEAQKRGQFALAEASYQRILRRWPADPDAQHFLGVIRFRQGDTAGALQRLRASLASAPGNPHAWMNLGNILLSTDDLAGAEQAYRRATEIEPGLADAWYNLGLCQRRIESPAAAVDSLRRAVTLRGNHFDSRYQLGVALKETGEVDAAIDEMQHALTLRPDAVDVCQSLGMLLYRQGRIAQAAEVYRTWLQHEPGSPVARHMLAATGADAAPARASNEYLATVFDQFAETFDANLGLLGYRAPELVSEALKRAAPSGTALDVLDAGCGTGLCGPLLAPITRRLTGVDISAGMVAQARERGVYDELVVAELCEFMASRATHYDAIVSADTLVYFGDLMPPLRAARSALRPDGLLVFTVEQRRDDAGGPQYGLEPHGRYNHTRRYAAEALEGTGFRIRSLEQAVLRCERGQDVVGLIVVAE